MTGKVVTESTKGFVFIEAEGTCQSVFCHISQVQDERCLHLGDLVTFDILPNPVRKGSTMAGNVVWIGREVSRA